MPARWRPLSCSPCPLPGVDGQVARGRVLAGVGIPRSRNPLHAHRRGERARPCRRSHGGHRRRKANGCSRPSSTASSRWWRTSWQIVCSRGLSSHQPDSHGENCGGRYESHRDRGSPHHTALYGLDLLPAQSLLRADLVHDLCGAYRRTSRRSWRVPQHGAPGGDRRLYRHQSLRPTTWATRCRWGSVRRCAT